MCIRYDIITIFPEFFESPFSLGILGKAQENGLIEIRTHDIRDFTEDRHRTVDDRPYGGGSGMVMKPEPLGRATVSAKMKGVKSLTVLTTPQGERFNDEIARELSEYDQIVIICGRYEGVDERIREIHVDKEVSIGDYILTGGEYAASVLVDSISRYVTGVLGNEASSENDSFSRGLLEHPQYTRPEIYGGIKVPSVLLSGNHQEIEDWRMRESLRRTFTQRPDLLDQASLSEEELVTLENLKKHHSPSFRVYIALVHYPVYNKKFEIVTTAFTNLDVHDIARSARTYGIKQFFLVQPSREQRKLVERTLNHWLDGPGGDFNPTRCDALRLVRMKKSIEEVKDEIRSIERAAPKVVATDARPREGMMGYQEIKRNILEANEPYLILFGTGWGMTEEVMESADFVLKPVEGYTGYNHLSVRSAVTAVLDRLFSIK